MDGDRLAEILALVWAELPEVDGDTRARVEMAIRGEHGAQRVYIARHAKRRHLMAMDQHGQDADTDRLARILGLSPRQVRNYKRLR